MWMMINRAVGASCFASIDSYTLEPEGSIEGG